MREQLFPVGADGKILGRLPCGDHSLKAVIRHRETQETILKVSVIDGYILHLMPRTTSFLGQQMRL